MAPPPAPLPSCYHLAGQVVKMTKSASRQQHIIPVIKWSYCHMSFFSLSLFFLKVSCESAISYISPVLPPSLPVIKGHIIRLSHRQKDGKGLRVEWTILHLTRGHESGHFFCTTRCPIRGKQRRVLRFITVCSATEMINVIAAPDLI